MEGLRVDNREAMDKIIEEEAIANVLDYVQQHDDFFIPNWFVKDNEDEILNELSRTTLMYALREHVDSKAIANEVFEECNLGEYLMLIEPETLDEQMAAEYFKSVMANLKVEDLEDKTKYKDAYKLLMVYWDSLPDEIKPELHNTLTNLGV